MVQQDLLRELGSFSGLIKLEEPLKKHTTWRIGGPAEILALPASEQDLKAVIDLSRQYHVPLTVLGNGSNVLVPDSGLKGIVVKISGVLNKFEVDGTLVRAGAGVSLSLLAYRAQQLGLSGLEFAGGIPAALGGAVATNAGTPYGSIGSLIREAKGYSLEGDRVVKPAQALSFDYRRSSIPREGLIITEVLLELTPGDQQQIKDRTKELLAERRAKQPLELPSAGSVFKNPPGISAGKLIELAGLKGLRRGDAQISEKHGNWILNLGSASAGDVLWLMAKAAATVEEKFGIILEPEIKIL